MGRQDGPSEEAAAPGEAPASRAGALDPAAALAGAVAHDLGNLLTVVLGNAELLVEGLAGRPDLAELAALILQAAQRGTELTERLDRFSRRIPPPPGPLELAVPLADFARRIAPGLPPGVVLDLQVAPGLRPVGLHPVAIGQALEALVANAVAALGGQGRLRIRAENRDAPDGTPLVRLSVEDEGQGMAAETLRRCRLPAFTSGIAGHRTALGLALAVRVAEAGGGALGIESAPGRGTRVTIDIVAQCR